FQLAGILWESSFINQIVIGQYFKGVYLSQQCNVFFEVFCTCGRKLTNNIERTNEIIKKNEPSSDITFPITEQELVPRATKLLTCLFVFNYIPDSYFEVISYPPPSWDIFEKKSRIEDDTPMQEIDDNNEQE
ncbi:14616_t:CDS:1, partial [Gigaspora rosea]